MKKPDNKHSNKVENSAIAIKASLVEPRMLKNLVEKLADRRYDMGHGLEKVQPGWQAIETSSIEAYVSGITNLSTKTDLVNLSFVTCFLFTCMKGQGEDYKLTWVSSLS